MEGNNWRAQGEPSMADSSSGGGDWRTQLQAEARQRIVNKIMETLKRHLPISVPEGLNELKKIAVRFEEKIYTAATSQSDYLRKISLKMLSMETQAQPSPPLNQTMSNSSVVNQNPADPGSLSVQSQGNNPGQPLAVPNRQSLLPQNLQNSSSAAPALPSISGLSQTMSGVTQGSNMQNMPGISQSSVNNSAGQIAQSDIYASAQRQMQERAQQQMLSQQQQQQQPQNQLLYQRQLQQQIMNKKLQQSSLMQAHMQQQQQQQLPPGQLQSTLQTNQSNMQQTQAANSQLASQSGLQQNQLNQIQQSASSLLQQNPQYVGRQPQAQQTSIQQQSILIPHQSTLTQQHQLMGQQGNMSSMQQNPLLGQQNNMSDIQQKQQRLQTMQQNNLLSMQQQPQLMNQQTMPLHQQQQQQLGSQSNMGGIQQQQHQLLGSLPSVSTMQPHQRAMMMQKNATQQQQQQQQQQLQQQTQQSSLALSQSQGQGQQSQHQSSQQQLMSQFQSQPSQLQQQMLLQQQSNSLQREMQQRLVSGNLLQSQNPLEQKPFIQQQRGLPEVSSSTSMDSTAQTGHAGAIDAQEEAYQKIKSMKELYFADLSEFHQKVAMKLQQQEQHLPPGKQSDQFKKLEAFKQMLEKLLHLLQIPKSSIPHNMKDKLVVYEKQMQSMIASHRTKKIPPAQQQQFQHANAGNSQPIPQQQQSSQVVQTQLPDKHQNSVQQINLPGNSLQSGGASSLQHMPMPLPTTQQNLSNTIQPCSNMDIQVGSFSSGQPGAVGSGHQGGMGSLQNSLSAPQQSNSNTLSQSTVNTLQANVGSMQPGSNVLQQQQQMKQEQQQLKQQFQHRQMQQQIYQHQQRQILQQQPLQQHLLQQQQQTPQLPVHQVQQQQLHSMNEPNEMKLRQGSGIKTALHEYTAGQRLNYYNQQQKQGAAFPVSSPQNLQASSPQISHHSSPQIDQNGLLSSIPKVKAQSANSPLVVTPSTPFAPSPILVDSDKNVPSIPSTLVHPQSSAPSAQPHSLAVSTPGISASPLLAECISQDGNQANLPATSRASATERPLERLIRAVQKTAPKVLISSVEDIESVVSMIDRIAGSAPGNGSRTAVGEELVAMTKCRLQARNFMSQDGGATAKKMKRHTSAMPLNNVSSAGSGNDSFKKLHGFESSELESTATSRVKRLKPEVNHTLLEEIEEINQKLIDSVVEVSDDDTDSVAAAASEGGEGTVIKCSYTAVALSPDLKAHFSAAQMSPIMPLRLLVPTSYPKCSPVLVDKLSVEPSGEFEDLSSQAMSKLSISLRGLSQPMSLGEMVRAWDACSRKVILEYAQRHGGGSFSTTYGSWENCISTA